MKILHFTLGLPPYRSGGLTKYSYDLMLSQCEAGHDVSLLYPGYFSRFKGVKIKANREHKGLQVYEIINPLPIPLLGGIGEPQRFMEKGDAGIYRSFLKTLAPDIIHMHTLMGIHREFLEVAKELGIGIVYTTHDYFGFCMKVNLIDSSGQVCTDFADGRRCVHCNIHGYSPLMIRFMQSRVYRKLKNNSVMKYLRRAKKQELREVKSESTCNFTAEEIKKKSIDYVKLREYYLGMFRMVDYFHFNSSVAKEVYESYLHPKGELISLTHSDIHDHRMRCAYTDSRQPLRILYLGTYEEIKGFPLMLESFGYLAKNGCTNWTLTTYGDDFSGDPKTLSGNYIFNSRYDYDQLVAIVRNADVLIIPSICKETFGFIGLEALSYGLPVMTSENAGFKDLIQHGKTGLVFKPTVEDLTKTLQTVINDREQLEDINANICAGDFSFAMPEHTEKILKLYSAIMNS